MLPETHQVNPFVLFVLYIFSGAEWRGEQGSAKLTADFCYGL